MLAALLEKIPLDGMPKKRRKNINEEAREIIKEVYELIDDEKKKKKARLPIPASIRPLQPEVPLAVRQQTASKALEI